MNTCQNRYNYKAVWPNIVKYVPKSWQMCETNILRNNDYLWAWAKMCFRAVALILDKFRQQNWNAYGKTQYLFDKLGSHNKLYKLRVILHWRLTWGLGGQTLAIPWLGFTKCNGRPTSAQKYARSPRYRRTLHRTDGINVHDSPH
jgi:hypothetical protein